MAMYTKGAETNLMSRFASAPIFVDCIINNFNYVYFCWLTSYCLSAAIHSRFIDWHKM